MAYINIETATKKQIIEAATIEKDLMSFLGGVTMIQERSIESLRSLLNMYFVLNTEVGAFYDKNGF